MLRRRGEFIERSFAHNYETGVMRRLHLKHRENIAKRVLIHVAGFNLGVLMRVKYGLSKPRGPSRAAGRALFTVLWMIRRLMNIGMRFETAVGLMLPKSWTPLDAIRPHAA